MRENFLILKQQLYNNNNTNTNNNNNNNINNNNNNAPLFNNILINDCIKGFWGSRDDTTKLKLPGTI